MVCLSSLCLFSTSRPGLRHTMKTALLSVDPSHFLFQPKQVPPTKVKVTHESDRLAIATAVEYLTQGEAVGIPTETVYGLAANALDAQAVDKIFAAKNRPQDNPLIVHVSSLDMLRDMLPQKTIPPVYLPVIKKCWPGPLTLLLPASSLLPPNVTCHHPTVAVRFPSHPVACAVIEQCGFPLAAPSANSSGKPSPTLASHVYNDLQGRIPLILDAGPCNVGVESTVLDGLRTPPAILRPGGVTYEMLKDIPGMEGLQVYRKDFVDKALEQAPTTPGMKYRHYSPDASVVLVERGLEEEDAVFHQRFEAILKKECQMRNVSRVGILKTAPHEEDVRWETKRVGDIDCIEFPMGRSEHPDEVARGMFKGLRALDEHLLELIFVQGILESREGMAVMNRLRKAASTIVEINDI
ncbi:DHBP synthase RibB-like alpha/beta domain-containing protein [Spinellus fusiger]|nr:DHBP synthase RibB-like alpha/beta domain-containing protein [Spinellus fusiger]